MGVRSSWDRGGVKVSNNELQRIAAENIRVPRAEFAVIWAAAEKRAMERGHRHVTDWRTGGVLMTCRWLAHATVRTLDGSERLERSPVTERLARAHPERIEVECLAAEQLLLRRPRPAWLEARPGWIEAVVATFDWAWRGVGAPPIPIGGDEPY